MQTFVSQHFDHFLCAAVFLSRLGDIGTTWLATRTLKLEANPIARKLGWPYALLTLLTCLVAYVYAGMAVAILTMSLMVSASNASKLWMARTLGEDEAQALQLRLIAKSGLMPCLLFNLLPCAFYMALAGVMFFFYPSFDEWAFYIAFGITAYSLALAIFYPIRLVRLHRRVVEERHAD